ncbi:hypothetical protein HAX54_042981 [Datura stramonium]|uniref:Uncharacterized protein n=1 Tax=Datura stramonium TaxID=4076 RepID=A0ABS8SN64_DATST|nr:hypothetical protein [Datura stramonium]
MEAIVGVAVEVGLQQFKEAMIEGINRGSLEGQQMREIQIHLDYMLAFLRDADSKEESHSSQHQLLVKQIRELAHHIEDYIHRYVCTCAYCRRDGVSKLKKIYGFLKNMVTCSHLNQSDLKIFMSTMTTISDACRRYTDNNSVARSWYDCRGDALLLEEAELVGIDRPKAELKNLIYSVFGSPVFKVICVVGMGGSGKSTLVNCAYNDPTVKKNFDYHIWITVSESLKVEEVNTLLLDAIRQLGIGIQQQHPPQAAAELKKVLCDFLQTKKYIVVLDDMWKSTVWDSIKYAFPQNQFSRVVITTRSRNIIRAEVNTALYQMKLLSDKESWTLFCRKAFASTASSCPPHLKKISKSILKRCEGLPLAIAIIGGALGTKGDDIQEWERFSRSLGAELGDDGDNSYLNLISITKLLSLSYYDLRPDLQRCFLYLSIFPEDYVIEKMRLIRLWVAEEFVQERMGLTIEEVAEGYLIELVNRSLIQVAATTVDNKIKTCRIHDLWRELILSKSKEQSFVAIVSEQEQRQQQQQHSNNASTKYHVRRMAVHSFINNVEIMESHNFKGLRSLLMIRSSIDDFPINSILMQSSQHFNLLKVLHLRGANLDNFPDEVFNLRHLKYLSMRDTQVTTVPKSIGRLGELQTLDLKKTNVTQLPIEILGLKQLRHLLIYRYEMMADRFYVDTFGFEAPYAIGCLVKMQKLCCIEAGESRGIKTVKEIGKLSQLRRLGITKLKQEDGKELCSSLEKLSHLSSLSINSIDNNETIDLNHNMPNFPQFLRNLSLRGHLLDIPPFISSLNSLVRVYLRWSRLDTNPLLVFQDLPSLVQLHLENAYIGDELVFQVGSFKLLKKLTIESLENLKLVKVEDGALPCLQKLLFRKCNSMKELPLDLVNLLTLKVLEAYDMSNEFVRDGKDKKKAKHWSVYHIHRIAIR